MTTQNRRDFIRTSVAGGTGVLVGLAATIEKALAVEAHRQTGSIRDVKHIAILMQENRGRRPSRAMSSMSDRYFVDTNILMYAHDTSAGEKHQRNGTDRCE